MEAIIVLLIIIGGPVLLAKILNHRDNVQKAENRKIRFSDWVTWYFLNPDIWKIYHPYHLYNGIVKRGDMETDEWYCFNFIDEQRFIHFVKNIQKENTQKAINKDIIELLEKVQEDIENIKEKSDKEINQARSEIDAFCRRSKEEE